MFFDKGNCRAVRLLHEASYFLEACLEKLLALEQEALSELKNETISNKNKSSESSNDILDECTNLECIPSTSSAIENESSYLSSTEHYKNKAPCEPKTISILDLKKLSPITTKTILKRKHKSVPPNENSKRCKCVKMMNQDDKLISDNCDFHINQSNIKNDQMSESTSELRIKNIQNENDLDVPVSNSNQDISILPNAAMKNLKASKIKFMKSQNSKL